MTTASPERSFRLPRLPRPRLTRPTRASRSSTTSTKARPTSWLGALREALDRPLTTYYLLLSSAALLLTIGLVMVLSSSSVFSFRATGDSYTIVRRQLMWVVVGLPCAFIASRVSHQWIRRLAYPAFSVSLILLLLTAFMGVERNGNTNWLALGPLVIQPSEIAKLSLVVWAAHIYANKERRLTSLHQIMVPVVPGMLLATGLVIVGRDLGTALILFAILIGMLWVVGAPARLFVMSSLLIGVLALALAATDTERLARITTFVDPFQDFHGTGWQPAHGLYAMSSGGIFGQGIGASQQKWGALPEAHTDYIFAVLGEELGLVGTLLVIALFLTIAFSALRIARHTEDPFVRYASFGVVVWLIGQMIVNVGMVLALLPVIGIPLPLVSYGGSSLLPTLAALGLLVGFARREPAAARALAQRKKLRSAGLSARR
ncbi:putative lipid II flippase FtsW [Nocardioides sp.]|uniref:putative lipid II flippase FtsW n=1 Tax=Nocardioides sp. TaxID=35761 RepID=UPI00271CA885|nr:putative lipid II flippase FtsW [Nocardioides sp.]MDO9455271.1 putative lipid II flippase FtsW [Nocardioides sp.]